VMLRHEALVHEAPPGIAVMTQLPSDTYDDWSKASNSRYGGDELTWRQVRFLLVPRLAADPGSADALFLHERFSPSGHRRAVAITLQRSWSREGTWLTFDIRLFEPGTLLSPRFRELKVKRGKLYVRGNMPGFPGLCSSLGTVKWGADFRMWGGIADAKDSSRFVIPYECNGVKGTFVGRLNDDDSIDLQDMDLGRLPVTLGTPAEPTTSKK
jgi:hypothetical protein